MRKLPIFTLLIPFLLFTNPVVFTPKTVVPLVEKDNAQVAHQWFNMFRILTKKTWGFTPPVAARAFGYAGLTLYESVVSGMPDHQSLQTQLSAGLKIPPPEKSLNYDWQIAANAAMAEVAKRYYPFAPQPQLLAANRLEEATEKRLIEENEVDVETVKRSKNYGKSVALVIFQRILSRPLAKVCGQQPTNRKNRCCPIGAKIAHFHAKLSKKRNQIRLSHIPKIKNHRFIKPLPKSI
jgi:hypothetical protein